MSSSSFTSAPAVVTVPPSPKPGGAPSKSAGNGDLSSSSSSSSSGPFLPVLRVSQLDAYALDNELLDVVFLKQLQKCVDIFNEQMSVQYKEEMTLFLEALFWYHTIRVDKPTPGMEMMNVTKILNAGHVGLVEHMGDDLTVVNAARVSFNKESEWDYDEELLSRVRGSNWQSDRLRNEFKKYLKLHSLACG